MKAQTQKLLRNRSVKREKKDQVLQMKTMEEQDQRKARRIMQRERSVAKCAQDEINWRRLNQNRPHEKLRQFL